MFLYLLCPKSLLNWYFEISDGLCALIIWNKLCLQECCEITPFNVYGSCLAEPTSTILNVLSWDFCISVQWVDGFLRRKWHKYIRFTAPDFCFKGRQKRTHSVFSLLFSAVGVKDNFPCLVRVLSLHPKLWHWISHHYKCSDQSIYSFFKGKVLFGEGTVILFRLYST